MNSEHKLKPLIWTSSDYTHKGHQRNENQDAVYSNCRGGLWCVADGMGGHAHGRMASQLLVKALSEMSGREGLETRVHQLEVKISALNNFLYRQGLRSDTHVRGARRSSVIGCTFVILLSDGFRCCCLWAGDSRLYLKRGSNLFRITNDHTVVQGLLDREVISLEQSRDHPQKHVVTRALGALESLTIDKKTFNAEEADRYLLCSDGLYNEMQDGEMLSALSEAEAHQSCRVLVGSVLKGSAPDNLSACVVSARSWQG